MKTVKKILCTILVAVMCLTSTPLQGFVGLELPNLSELFSTEASALSEGYYTYTVSNDEVTITDVNTSISGNIVIPTYLEGYKVTKIGDKAFSNCKEITGVTIPSTVTHVGAWSFRECKNLKNLVISEGVERIDDHAFYSCNALIEVTIPTSLKTCGVGSIFIGCINLEKVIFAEGTTSIPAYIFNCADDINPTIIIPETVTSIGDYAFSARGLTNILLPKKLTSIGNNAFWGCRNIRNIELPNSVTSIGDAAFGCCYNLENITIPDGVTEIRHCTFWLCENLKSIVIPKSIKSIEEEAFGGCKELTDVYYEGTEQEWNSIDIDYVTLGESGYADRNVRLKIANKHYNYNPASCFMISSEAYSVDSVSLNETPKYKVSLLDNNSCFMSVDGVTFENQTGDVISITTSKKSETEIELKVKPLKEGDATIKITNADNTVEEYFCFNVYSNTTTYRADKVPVTDKKLKTNFSRGDLTVDNFEYIFDENKNKYIATMDVYNMSGAIGVVAAYTQDGLISDIEQVDPFIPLPGNFGEFLGYLGSGAVSIAKGENWNYRYTGYSKKTSIKIEVPEDGYLTVSCDVTACEATMIYSFISLGVEAAFKTAAIIDYLGTDTDELAKDVSKTLMEKNNDYFKSETGKNWHSKAETKISKKLAKQFSTEYLEYMSMLSLDLLEEMYQEMGTDFATVLTDTIYDLVKEEIKDFGIMAATRKLIKDKVIEAAEESFLKVAKVMFEGGDYINFANRIVGTYLYNHGTGKTMIVFKPKGENGFICKDTLKVISDVITDEVLLNTYVLNYREMQDAFIRKEIYPDFNRDNDLDEKELSIDLNRIVEIHEISLIKNGKEIDSTFKATVEMELPSYLNPRTCCVYRVERDGSYTKLKAEIKNGKLVFETDHFSQYILTGIVNGIEETTPCDDHVYSEVRVEPTCTEIGSITYTCYCGDTYTENIEATGHDFDGNICRNCGFNRSETCGCICHKTGFVGFIYKIVRLFWRLFKIEPVCQCGVNHY